MQRLLLKPRELSLDEHRDLIENAIIQYKTNRGIGTAKKELSAEKKKQIDTVHSLMRSAETSTELTTKIFAFCATLGSTRSFDGGLSGMIKKACTQAVEHGQVVNEQEQSKKEEAAKRSIRSLLVRRERIGYDLGLMSDSKRLPGKIYLAVSDVGLRYELIDLEGILKSHTIQWSSLPSDFPRSLPTEQDKDRYVSAILSYSSTQGHSYDHLKFWRDNYLSDTQKYMASVRFDLKYLGFVAVLLGPNYSGFTHQVACENSEKFVDNVVLNTKAEMLKIAYYFYTQCSNRQRIEDVLRKQKLSIEQKYQKEMSSITKGFDLACDFIGQAKLKVESKSKEGEILKSLCDKGFSIATEDCSAKIASLEKEKNIELEALNALENESKKVLSENQILDAAVITACIEGEEKPSLLMQYNLCLMTPGLRRKPDKQKLYVEAAGKGSLQYTVIAPDNSQKTGIITTDDLNELKDQAKEPLDLKLLNPLLPRILEITSKRGHTFATLSPKAHELFSKYEELARGSKSETPLRKVPANFLNDFVINTLENMYEDNLSKKEKHDAYVKLHGADEIVTKAISDQWKRPVYSEDESYLRNINERMYNACHFYVSHTFKRFAREFVDENIDLECKDLESKAYAVRQEYLRLKATIDQNEALIQTHDHQNHMDDVFKRYSDISQQVIRDNAEFKEKNAKHTDLINRIDNSQIGKVSPLLISDEKGENLVDFAVQQYITATTQAEKENIFKLLELLLSRGALVSSPSELCKDEKRDFVSVKVSIRIILYSMRMLLSTNSSVSHVWSLIKLSLENTPVGSELQVLLKNILIKYCDDSLKSISRWNPPAVDEMQRIDKIYEVMSAVHYAYVNCDDTDLLNKMILLKDESLDNNNQRSLREAVRDIERKVERNQLFCFYTPVTTPFHLGIFRRSRELPNSIPENENKRSLQP